MSRERDWQPNNPFPAWFPDRLGEFLGSDASPNFQVRARPNAPEALQIPAGPNNDQIGIAIEGTWRWIASTLELAGPGGGTGQYDVYVTAQALSFQQEPSEEIDNTNRLFGMAIVPSGAAAPSAAYKRRVALAQWDGTTGRWSWVAQLVGTQPGTPWHPGDLKWTAAAVLGQVPPGWLIADGRAVSRIDYAALYIGLGGVNSPYGQGDGSTTFNLPDGSAGRTLVGSGGTYDRGEKGGAETHTLSAAQMPAHQHGIFGWSSNAAYAGEGKAIGGSSQWSFGAKAYTAGVYNRIQTADSSTAGSSYAHNNMPPFQVGTLLVKT